MAKVSEILHVGPGAPLEDDPTGFAAALVQLVLGSDDESIASLRRLCRELPIVVWAIDEDGRFTHSYGRGLARFDLDDDEGVGLDVKDFGDSGAAYFVETEDGSPASHVVEGHTDGEPFSFLVYSVHRPGEGAVAIAIDTTDETRAEQGRREVERTERRFRLLAESSPIGIIVIDEEGRVEYANPVVAELQGIPRDDLVGHEWDEYIPESERDFVAVSAQQILAGHRGGHISHRVTRPDGTVRWVRSRPVVLADSGQGERIMATVADITESLVAAERLRESDERTRAILESAAEGIVTCDGNGTIVEFNAAAERIFGVDSDLAIGRHLTDFVADHDVARVASAVEASGPVLRATSDPVIEVAVVRPEGEEVPVEVRFTRVATSAGPLVTGMMRDISERRAFERALEHQATHDQLTGLPNRALFLAQVERALSRTDRREHSVAVLFFELERIEMVIGSLGHTAADEVLREGVIRLQDVLGRGTTLARLVGGQFVALVDDRATINEVVSVAERAAAAMSEPFHVRTEEVFLSSPVGIAFAASDVVDGETLISNGDVAMRRAKERSDDRIEIFDSEMRSLVESRHKLEVALRYGIDRGEFELHYQPVVGVADGRLRGFEALARWNHPALGLLPPSNFIPLAEESGLVGSLGNRLLSDACAQLARWQQVDPDIVVSVNLSGYQLSEVDLVERVEHHLSDAGADPAGLHLEITESILLRDVDSATSVLERLKLIGAGLSLDDFGTGYSSLTYLCRFPIDVVKIDQSFVSQLGTTGRDASIVTMIVGMAQTLGLDVVAEGVETRRQLDLLATLGCGLAQGFFHARPGPAELVEKWFDEPFAAASP